MTKIETVVKKLKTRKSKNVIYTIVIALVVGAFAYRFYMYSVEQNTKVFNITRNNIENGLPVDVLEMHKTDGVLYEPLNIKDNRAFVDGKRVKLFKAGQKIGNCKIASVSQNIDLDFGMYVIRTKNCEDGLQNVELKANGFYVPVSAIEGNTVFVTDGETAHVREIVIGGRDSQNALIKSGLNDGDIVILSDVHDNQKIKIEK